jgi:hypothetical protein
MRRGLVFIFDNVDRRDREAQLQIFQTAQWFKNLTHSFCVVSLRDETYENYKNEKPLDAFINAGHFYIQPPRFIDMVRRRLDLAITFLISEAKEVLEYDIEGLGRVRYPKSKLGEYLNTIYVDLFRRKRKITMILEGLAGKNVRRALDMFSTILTSGHLDTRQFTLAALTSGAHRFQETNLIKALMRTNYLYFFDGHGFTYNLYDFAPGVALKNHVLKFELLEFLVANRKRLGDARFEGYFSAGFLIERFRRLGFPDKDTHATLEVLLNQGLIVADHMRTAGLGIRDSVRVHASGFIHIRVLAARTDYIAAAALVTPVSNRGTADKVGRLWQITDPHKDIARKHKNAVVKLFLDYLQSHTRSLFRSMPLYKDDAPGSENLLRHAREAIGFARRPEDRAVTDQLEMEYDRLFSSGQSTS